MRRPLAASAVALLGLACAPSLQAQCERAKLFPGDGSTYQQFGTALSVADGVVLSGAQFNDLAAQNAGAAYVYELVGHQWLESPTLFASDAALDDRYGSCVAVDAGRIAVVGARYNDDKGYGSGSVYLYDGTGPTWVESHELVASNEEQGGFFGDDVAIEGPVIVVGATYQDALGVFESGSAYVFERQGTDWVETAILAADDGRPDDRFGSAVAISGDTIAVGAYGVDDPDDDSEIGRVYLYERQGGQWLQTASLTSEPKTSGALFGRFLDLQGDVLVVGAGIDHGAETESGTAYVFERIDGEWVQTARLFDEDGASGDLFGNAVAIHDDMLAISAWGSGASAGSVSIFKRLPQGWTRIQKLTAADTKANDNFGFDLDWDGEHLVVGARGTENPQGKEVGGLYVFTGVGQSFPYGQGCAGSGGFVPSLTSSGCPSPGGTFSLTVEQGLGGATTFLFLGLEPIALPVGPMGCSFLVNPILPIDISFALAGAGAGDGAATLDFALPLGVPEVTLVAQAWVLDGSVTGLGASSTNGVQFTIK